MKPLQNNFTTPEQSKRLIKLGVPADSADCIYIKHIMNSDFFLEVLRERSYSEEVSEFEGFYNYIPCWSVGRLMEIYLICKADWMAGLYFSSADMINSLIDLYKAARLDFSKLEE